jgi:hypothetical protein
MIETTAPETQPPHLDYPEWSRFQGPVIPRTHDWRAHAIQSIKGLEGLVLGHLSIETVEKLRAWYEKASQLVEPTWQVRDDVWAIKHALICAQRFQDSKKNVPHGTSVPKKADRPDRPVSAPSMNLPNEAEGISKMEQRNYDLLDPAYIKTAESFIASCEAARKRLRETEDPSELRRIGTYADLLRALASTIGLGREFESLGKGLRFEAYYRVAQVREKRTAGRPRTGENPPEVGLFDATEERLMRLLTKFEEEEFERLLHTGIKDGTLSKKTFKTAPPSKKSQGLSASESTRPAGRISNTSSSGLLEWAWTIITNAGGGDWTKETQDWQDAAAKWREAFFKIRKS